MSRSKKVFVAVMVIFFGLLAYASFDISRRTTFPGSKPQLQERIKDVYMKPDSVENDTSKREPEK